MNRRDLLLLLGGAVTATRGLRAQQKAMPVIGYLSSNSPSPSAPLLAAFRQGLSEVGYVEGQNLVIEYRWAEGLYDRLPALAADLVGRKVDVMAATGGSAHAAKNATSTIPIVFTGSGDPVGDGLIATLARPGGNVTGVTFMTPELTPKWVELLSEMAPQSGVIALLVNPNDARNAERTIREVGKRRTPRCGNSTS
jgi:putative ABC transport system substrate-binding protein